MGGKKAKKFVDRRYAATFHLRPAGESPVFVRVDSNPMSIAAFDDDGGDAMCDNSNGGLHESRTFGELPEQVRQEIVELGLPDDGYNYLHHLREIGNASGAAYYANPKPRIDSIPLDIKAYDASRLRVELNSPRDNEALQEALRVPALWRVEKAVDPDVVRLLEDDSDLSRVGSEVEELEEDFVVRANLSEGDGDRKGDGDPAIIRQHCEDGGFEEDDDDEISEDLELDGRGRVHRMLDKKFEMLALEEYADSDDSDDNYVGGGLESFPSELIEEFKEFQGNNLHTEESYRVPADFGDSRKSGTDTQSRGPVEVIQRCIEYAERYDNDDEDEQEVVLVLESSDDGELWDCETIISTHSNLVNHPGKIEAPGNQKARLPKVVLPGADAQGGVIKLQGREMLPVQYLPLRKSSVKKEKQVKPADICGAEKPKGKVHRSETKEEKKERKAAVKKEREEARRAKKELKSLYGSETQRAQRAAAVLQPASIRLI